MKKNLMKHNDIQKLIFKIKQLNKWQKKKKLKK